MAHSIFLTKLLPFVWLLLLTSQTFAEISRSNLNYSDVQKLGKSCPKLESCAHKRTVGSRGLDGPRERNCACDYLCDQFRDCCIDAPNYDKEATEPSKDWKCFELRQFGGVYMRDKCSSSMQNPLLIDLCEKSDPEDFSDPLKAMPVSDITTGMTYKNFYCGVCNGKKDDLHLWTPRLECPTLTFYNNTRKNLTHEYVFQNLIYDGSNWGVYLDGDNGSLFFHDCMIDPVMPRLLESKIRLCKMSVSECASDWADDSVKAMCASYTGLRYYHSESYRNVHCAMCNRVNISLLTCHPVEYRDFFAFRTFGHNAFSLLLDINEHSGQNVGMVQQCDDGEIYDPFFKRCRRFSCLPGTVKEGQRCVPESQSTTEPINTVTFIDTVDNSTDVESSTYVADNATEIDPDNPKNHTKHHNLGEKDHQPDNSSGISYNTTMLDNNPHLEDLGKYKNCLLIKLLSDDYIMFQNKTIYVAEYDKTYEPTNYFAEDDSVLVCSHFNPEQNQKFSNAMGHITIVGLGVSMVCLFLHFVVFCIVPDLRNLSGKNLMSQCIALFFAYTFYIISQAELSTEFCTATAFFIAYFFLASFFWMSSMAFDVWRTLKMATTELRVTSGQQWKRFVYYSIFSWLFPLMILGVTLFAEYSDYFPEEYKPRFGQPLCWFNSRRALLCYFATPLITVTVTNIILFGSSARMIILTTRTTVKQHNPSHRRNFKLYFRLFILMGLTWTVGIVAGYVDSDILWYCFVVLNTLQGLFIFVSFSCTSKVLNYLKDKVSKIAKTSDYRSSASHSTSHSGYHTNSTTALSSSSMKATTKLWPNKKHAASPSNSSASNYSKR